MNAHILKEIIRELIQEDKLLIFSSHQMNYVEEFCQEIALIDKGKIVLTGDLGEIKRRWGKDRLTISEAHLSPKDLEGFFRSKLSRIARPVEIKNHELIIELLHGRTKNELLAALGELDLDIEKFSIYQPTLEDIFVKTVGDQS